MRINLGSGPRKVEGFIGVDIHPGADVQCNVLELPADWDGKVEEILSVHLVEHLAQYEIQPALREWKRVLQPGGKIAIECPDLRKACLAFLQDPDNLSYGMHVFYGDQSRGDIFTVHKNGFTAASLKRELERAGFVDCVEVPAQFKKGPKRDLRVEARKP